MRYFRSRETTRKGAASGKCGSLYGPRRGKFSLCMYGRMIYFDQRVYTQCALITKIFIADRLETPVAFDNGQVFIEAMIISNMIPRFISFAMSTDKNSPYKFNNLFQLFILNLAWCWK